MAFKVKDRVIHLTEGPGTVVTARRPGGAPNMIYVAVRFDRSGNKSWAFTEGQADLYLMPLPKTPAASATAQKEAVAFKVGDRVTHTEAGDGTVVKALCDYGGTPEALLVVRFDRSSGLRSSWVFTLASAAAHLRHLAENPAENPVENSPETLQGTKSAPKAPYAFCPHCGKPLP